MKMNYFKSIGFATLILLAACNDGTNTSTNDTAANTDTTKNNMGFETREEDFVTDVIEANAEELAWLKAGLANGTDAELKAHAQHMITDHEKMEKEVDAYVSKKNINTSGVDTSATVNLNEDKGNEWDEEWADEMGDKHRQLIRRFERAEKRVDDAELKNLITQSLPTLRSHLDMVEKLEAKLDKK